MIEKNMQFESSRLFFRGITRGDAENLVRWRSDEAIIRFFIHSKPITMEQHLSWFDRYLNDQNRYDYIVSCKVNGAAIGVISLSELANAQGAELGYAISEPEYQRQGYAKEAILALMQFATRQFGIQYFRAEIHKENIASIRTITSLGFHPQGGDPFVLYQHKSG